jgi:hypothetical protein
MARVAIGAEEKKKLYVLGGLLAAIMVVVFVLYRPTGKSSSPDETPPPKSGPAAAPKPAGGPPAGAPGAAPGGAPAGEAAPSGGTGGSGAGGSITAASLVSVSDFRNDPFEPFAKPVPTPTPPPPPPPPGPVVISPPQVFISQPGGDFGGGLPPFGISSTTPSFGGTPPSRILTDLPPPYIPRLAIAPTAPSNFLPPGGGSGGSNSRSSNKRLSGVIIGDSVRAILEISDGQNVVTRIVQPGDEVDGIRILRIERVSEGGRLVTRMFIREAGEERFVDLKAAPQQAAGGAGGIPGMGAPGPGTRPPF